MSSIVTAKQVKSARYRARKQGLPADLTWEEWIKIFQDFGQSCAYCGNGEVITLGHFIPLKYGGGSCIDNCVPSCHNCNHSKSDQLSENASQISRVAIKRVECYLAFRRQGQRYLFEKSSEKQGDEEKTNERVTPKRVDQKLVSGERVTLFYDQQQIALQIGHSSQGDSLYASGYQITAQLTSTECLNLATKLLNAIAPQENETLPSGFQEAQTTTGERWKNII